MFVRQLIGRQAGEIMEMRADVAQACLAVGSAAPVTDEELHAAGIALPKPPPANTAPALPEGYEALSRPDGLGFDLYRTPVQRGEGNVITSEALNPAPLPNMVAVRDFAATLDPPATPATEIPEGWQDLKADEMKALAVALGADPAPATKAEAAAFVEAEVARRTAATQPQA